MTEIEEYSRNINMFSYIADRKPPRQWFVLSDVDCTMAAAPAIFLRVRFDTFLVQGDLRLGGREQFESGRTTSMLAKVFHLISKRNDESAKWIRSEVSQNITDAFSPTHNWPPFYTNVSFKTKTNATRKTGETIVSGIEIKDSRGSRVKAKQFQEVGY